MNAKISTDVELARVISSAIGRDYEEGSRYIQTVPKHALVMFRHVLEALCDVIQERSTLEFCANATLFETINELKERSVITFRDADTMQKVRIGANSAAHRQLNKKQASERSDVGLDVLPEIAKEARINLVSLLKSFYEEKSGKSLPHEIVYEEFDDLQLGHDLYLASTTSNAADKYKAGLICEALSERELASAETLVVSARVKHQFEFLRRQAALFFQVADQIEPNDDARYRYALAVWEGLLDADRKAEAFEALRLIADRGHAEACLYFGVALSIDESKVDQALTYWRHAVELGNAQAYFCIGQIYLDEGARGPAYAEVISNWSAGVELDDPDCLMGLGRLYFEGEHITQDREKADSYITRAASLGHRGAQGFKMMYLDGGLQELQRTMAEVGKNIARARAVKPKPVTSYKQPANGLCPCKSGKKYKKCCGAGQPRKLPSIPPFGA